MELVSELRRDAHTARRCAEPEKQRGQRSPPKRSFECQSPSAKGRPQCRKKSPVLITTIPATRPATLILTAIATSRAKRKRKFPASIMIIRVINRAMLTSMGIATRAVQQAVHNRHLGGWQRRPPEVFSCASQIKAAASQSLTLSFALETMQLCASSRQSRYHGQRPHKRARSGHGPSISISQKPHRRTYGSLGAIRASTSMMAALAKHMWMIARMTVNNSIVRISVVLRHMRTVMMGVDTCNAVPAHLSQLQYARRHWATRPDRAGGIC